VLLMALWVVNGNSRRVVATQGKVMHAVIGGAKQGTPGIPGVGGGTYEHVQSIAASTWNVNHLLGFKPNVSVKTAGGLEVIAEVLHLSDNQANINFDAPSTGIATFS
jgi:hypothetical protein